MMRANPIFVSNMQPLAANQRIIQKFVKVASQVQKGEEIMKLLKTEFKEYMHKSLFYLNLKPLYLSYMLKLNLDPTGKPRALVFIKTKRDADRLALLCGQTTGLIMASLHG